MKILSFVSKISSKREVPSFKKFYFSLSLYIYIYTHTHFIYTGTDTDTHTHIYMRVCSVAKLCPVLYNTMDCSQPDSSVHEIFQAGILEWVARGSS